MIPLKKLNAEAYQAVPKNGIVSWGIEEMRFLESARQESPRKRSRILCHPSVDALLHSFPVAYGSDADAYVRAHHHRGKDESFLIVRGVMDLIYFDPAGCVKNALRLGALEPGETVSSLPYYARIPAGWDHTVIFRSPEVVLYEETMGPFDPADTVYADWSPAEKTLESREYQAELERRIGGHLDSPSLLSRDCAQGASPGVFVATYPAATLDRYHNNFLHGRVKYGTLDRCRICVHRTETDPLHEMLLMFAADSYIRPSRHAFDESLYVVEGQGQYVFFDDNGEVRGRVLLGPLASGRACYARVPAGAFHALLLNTEMLVKISCPGPFRKEATEFASWAPTEQKEGIVWLESLGKQAL